MAGKGSTELNLDERRMIESLVKKHKTGSIAEALGRSHSCIKLEIRRGGGRDKYNAEEQQNRSDARKEAKRIKLRKGFTEEQEKIIKEGVSLGYSINKIGKLSGIGYYRIRSYLDEENISVEKWNYMAFQDRIQQLEEHVNIILDQIRELKNERNK